MTPTWIVWSMMPPENPEKVCCSSMLDAARAWAERQFRKGLLARSGTEVLVRCANDPPVTRPTPASSLPRSSGMPSGAMTATTYQVKITIVNAPAFRTSLVGVAYEGVNGEPTKGGDRG